jgi:non-lysosomal glucosylceramidase
MRYRGRSLDSIAFPIGGIGTGTVSLGGRGDLRDWEVFNRPGKGTNLPSTFFAIRASRGEDEPIARVLERRLVPPFGAVQGLDPGRAAGLPRLDDATFRGAYPFASIQFRDARLPLSVRLEAFNPMVPHDAEDSSLPVAIFLWHLTNDSDRPADATVALSIANTVGYDGVGPLSGPAEASLWPSGPSFGGNVNRWRRADGVSGLEFTQEGGDPAGPGAGSMSMATDWPATSFLEHWPRDGWFEALAGFWERFRDGGVLPSESTASPSPAGRSDVATLALHAHIPPAEAVTLPIVVAWHFPNLVDYWDDAVPLAARRLGNHYTGRHADAWSAAQDVLTRLDALHRETRLFADALFSSTFPSFVLDALSSQMSTMRTATFIRIPDGSLYAFEGCDDTAGSCPLNCTHVFNYEQTLAHLYPGLERTMRETDYAINTNADGKLAFRTRLPADPDDLIDYFAAADGQLGALIRLYREWQLSGDTEWLRGLWPAAKRSLEWAWRSGSWDPDRDGVIDGEQHTTYDVEFYGPNPLVQSLYLGALRAASRMAEAVGDTDLARECSAAAESGSESTDSLLWNGEYYEQSVRVVEESIDRRQRKDWHTDPLLAGEPEPRHQYGKGCLSDQLLGQWLCHVVGLGYVLPRDHIRTALQAIVAHNWKLDLSEHESCQRTYALGDEPGLLLCTWPRGGRPQYPFPYADEVWTGVEYQVAAHLIYEGCVDEGLRIVEATRSRHDGAKRNPWDEPECGHHYVRALSSWSLLLALSGFEYSAVEGRLRFAPKVSQTNFRSLFTTGSAWGTYAQRVEAHGRQLHTVRVLGGSLTVTCLEVPDVRRPGSFHREELNGGTVGRGEQVRVRLEP